MAKSGESRRRESGNTLVDSDENSFDYSNYKQMTVKDYFIEYLFPEAIIYGMSYDEFWFEDPELFFSYRFSYIKKMKLDQEMINYTAWLNGLYNYEALCVSLGKAFGSKKVENYPSKPHNFNNDTPKKSSNEEFLEKRKFWSRFKERSNR